MPGLGESRLRNMGMDGACRLDVAQRERAIEEDSATDWRRIAVVAAVGTTSTASGEPVPQIADLCAHDGLWLLVDTAYASGAAAASEMLWALAGCERADSLTVDPNTCLIVPCDGSVFCTRRPEVVKAACSVIPAYLRGIESEAQALPNVMDGGISLTHCFHLRNVWMVLNSFGMEGRAAPLREHIRLARQVAQWVEKVPDVEYVAPTPFSAVCFRPHPNDMSDEAELNALHERLMNRINAAGRFSLSHSKGDGTYAIHSAIGKLDTREQHVRDAWSELQEACKDEVMMRVTVGSERT